MRAAIHVLGLCLLLALAPKLNAQESVLRSPDSAGEHLDEAEQPADGAALELDPSWAWTVTIKPMLWVPGFAGDLDLPASSNIDVEIVDADETNLAPAGLLALQAGDLRFEFRGFGVSLDEAARAGESFTLGGSPVLAGDRVSTDIEFASFDLTGGYRVWTPIEDASRDVRLGLDLYGGLRVHSLDVEIESGASSSRDHETWFQPILGARMVVDLPHRFGVQTSLDFGWMPLGDDEAASADVTASFLWRPHPNVGAEIGFRHHQFNLSSGSGNDEFGFDGWLAGLYGAVTIRF